MKKEKSLFWLKYAVALISFVFLCFIWSVLICHVFIISQVHGDSMAPTVSDNQNVLFTTIVGNLHRKDIVLIKHPVKKETYLIKRVIGLPGDTIYIDVDSSIYINDELLEEDYLAANAITFLQGHNFYELGEDEYFVLGDNRSVSADSREYGTFNKEDIISKVVVTNSAISFILFGCLLSIIPAVIYFIFMSKFITAFQKYFTETNKN